MGKIKKAVPVKLIIGFIYKEESVLLQAKKLLLKCFGKIDFESTKCLFNHTDYYEQEFGKDLFRKFMSFSTLIPADKIADIKIFTNAIEKKLAEDSFRKINIDPGYINLSKLVLATTKDYIHRIYLGKGIYAEMTLFYRNKTFNPWEWTYTDYKTQHYLEIFAKIRELYAKQIQPAKRAL